MSPLPLKALSEAASAEWDISSADVSTFVFLELERTSLRLPFTMKTS
jgi:hypothetical protein